MTDDLTAFDRRKRVERDGYRLEYSIPAGVTDEAAAAEVEKCERNIERGYSYKLSFHDAGPEWLRLLLTARDKIGFWIKCRWLDVYWCVKDARASRSKQAKGGSIK